MAEAFKMLVTYELTGPCTECGITYGLPDNYKRSLLDSHRTFYCPNGHPQHFPGKSELEKTKELLETERRWRAQERAKREAEEKSHAATRGQITKLKNRITNGICPCCNRTFKNLQRHMKTKHPDQVEKGRDI